MRFGVNGNGRFRFTKPGNLYLILGKRPFLSVCFAICGGENGRSYFHPNICPNICPRFTQQKQNLLNQHSGKKQTHYKDYNKRQNKILISDSGFKNRLFGVLRIVIHFYALINWILCLEFFCRLSAS